MDIGVTAVEVEPDVDDSKHAHASAGDNATSTATVLDSDEVSAVIDISQSKFCSPCQPRLSCFPKTAYGKQHRSFQSSWYNKYIWLEYSEKRNAAYCFCCRWFRSGNQSLGGLGNVFVQSGYTNWQKASQPGRGLDGHDQSAFHRACFGSWKLWQEGQLTSNSIIHQLSNSQLARNRVYLSYVANLVRFLVIHEKPMRGTHEVFGSDNSGFF